MNALLIVGGLAAFWFLLQRRQAAMGGSGIGGQYEGNSFVIGSEVTAGNLGGSNTGALVGGGIGLAGGAAQNVASILKKAEAVPIIGIVASIGSQIASAFTQAHVAAMKKEAGTINAALPNFIKQVQQVMDALEQNALTEADAIAYLQQAQDDYYTTVSGIIHGQWQYQGSEFPEPTWADSYKSRSGPFGSSSKNPDSHAPDPCNAACVLGHYMVERTVVGLTKIIKAGGGTMVIESFPNNGMIQGTPAVQISYQRKNKLLGQAASGFESFLLGLGL